jgi:hypothetical protein
LLAQALANNSINVAGAGTRAQKAAGFLIPVEFANSEPWPSPRKCTGGICQDV